MDTEFLQRLLVAPVSHRSLHLTGGPSGTHLVTEGEPREYFQVVLGIPILIPPGLVADWDHNVLELVLGENTHAVVGEAYRQHGQSEAAIQAVSAWIRDRMGPAGVRRAIRVFSQRHPSDRVRWRLTGVGPNGQPTEPVSDPELQRARGYATRDNGMKRILQAQQNAATWGHHLPCFQRLLGAVSARTAVELGCGAGVGTYLVLESIGRDAHLFAVDVDFVCAANCLGIREAADRVDTLHPVVASFWHLPFADASIDLVCSHYGMDETREVTAALREIGRVLRPGGSMISVSKTDPTERLKVYLGDLGLTDTELTTMAQEADLYAGPDHFAARANACDLRTESVRQIDGQQSHDRTVFQFRKA